MRIFAQVQVAPNLARHWREVHAQCFRPRRLLLLRCGNPIVIRELTNSGLQLERLAVSPYGHCRVAVGGGGCNQTRQVAQVSDVLPIERQNDVALLKAGSRTRAVRCNDGHESALLAVQAEARRDRRCHLLNLYSKPAAADLAVLLELDRDCLRNVGRYGKANADASPVWGIDRSVDANHFAFEIEGWPAGIAAIDRRVDLQNVVDRTRMDIAPRGRNIPGGHRPAKAERVSDRHYPIADLSRAAVAEGYVGQRLVRCDLQNSDVSLRVPADDLRRVFALVRQSYFHFAVATDYVTIGHHVAGRINNEAGTECNTLGAASRSLWKHVPLAARPLLLEKAAQKLVKRRVGKSRGGGQFRLFSCRVRIGTARHRYIYNRGRDLPDQWRKALVLDQCNRRRHRRRRRLRCLRRAPRSGRVFGPDEGR